MNDRDKAIQAEALRQAARECTRLGDLCRSPSALNGSDASMDRAEAYDLAAAAILDLAAYSRLLAVPRDLSDRDVEAVAREMLHAKAARPSTDGTEYPILDGHHDFEDLPHDHRAGTKDDDITRTAILRLARVAIEAFIGQAT